MRSLETQAVREAKEQNKRKIIGISLLILMVLSTAGYAFAAFNGDSNPKPTITSSQLKVGDRTFNLINSKETVSSVDVPISFRLLDYSGKIVYLDSNLPAASYEVASTIGAFTGKMQEACYLGCDRNLPEKNCSSLMIVINSSAPNSIRQNESCVFIDGDLKQVDAFIYKVFQGVSS